VRRTGSLLTAIINEGPRPRGVDGGADDAVQRERWCRCCCNPSFFRCAEVCGGVRPPLGWLAGTRLGQGGLAQAIVNRDDEELAAIGLRGPILAHQL